MASFGRFVLHRTSHNFDKGCKQPEETRTKMGQQPEVVLHMLVDVDTRPAVVFDTCFFRSGLAAAGFSVMPASVIYRLSRSSEYGPLEYSDLGDNAIYSARFTRQHPKSMQATASFP